MHYLALNYNSLWIFKQSELKLCFLSLLRPSSWKTCSAREAFSCVGYFSPTPTFSLIFTLPLVNIHSLSFCAKKTIWFLWTRNVKYKLIKFFICFSCEKHIISLKEMLWSKRRGERESPRSDSDPLGSINTFSTASLHIWAHWETKTIEFRK